MLTKRRRRLPHWTLDGAYYYITFNLQSGKLTNDEMQIVLEHIKSGHIKFYILVVVQIMSDHVHLIAKPDNDVTLERMMKGIKGVSARLINQHRNTIGSVWQQEYCDRIIRTQSDWDEKMKYIYENPLRAGIVEDPDAYPGWYLQE